MNITTKIVVNVNCSYYLCGGKINNYEYNICTQRPKYR